MPEPFSTTVVAGYSMAVYLAWRANSAVSPEAGAVRESASAIVESVERSFALFGNRSHLISDVYALAEESASRGERDEETLEISSAVVEGTISFIRALPDDVPLPEIASEPDGSLSLDWIASRTRVFSLSVGSTSRLAFAWIDGTDRGHGVTRFDGAEIPSRILTGIREIVNERHAELGAA